jgi:uncharacterized lipoprotein
MKLLGKGCLILITLTNISACSKVETDSRKTTIIEQETSIDSMPIIEPELPETTIIIKPKSNDSMPTVHPQDIKIQ